MHKKNIFKKIILLLLIPIILLIIVFFAIQKQPKILDESRIKIINKIGENYFYRGSNPYTDLYGERKFNYHKLKQAINENLQKNNQPKLDDFYLIDLNLLNIDNYFQIQSESNFFNQYPRLGEVIQHSEINPKLLLMPFYQNPLIYKFTKDYHENLDNLIAQIHEILSNPLHKPIIIYAHCNAGRDRTGLISAGYRMRYQNMTLKQAINQNIIDVNRSSESFLEDAIIAYCNYLLKNNLIKNSDNQCAL